MPTNEEVIRVLNETGNLLEILGEADRFKIEAYRRAARSLESVGEDLGQVHERGELRSIPGIGEAIAEKIGELLRTGRLEYYEKLRSQVAPGVLELMRIPGVGPKTTRRFLLELQVDSPVALAAAIEAGRLTGVRGFGAKKVEQLRVGLQTIGAAGPPADARRPILVAWELAERVAAALRAAVPTTALEVAGSLRRGRESIGDIDMLVTAPDAPAVFDAFSALPGVQEIRLRGDTKETVIFAPGIQIDLRVVPPESWGAALQYFTGSKDHNIRLRTMAREKGLKINEYSVQRGDERVAGLTEEEVYRSLGLPWIPPEIREDRGEIEAALGQNVPTLVSDAELLGDLGLRPVDPDPETAPGWRAAATALGLRYVGVVLPAGEAIATAWHRRWNSARSSAEVGLLIGQTAPHPPSGGVPKGTDYRVLESSPAADAGADGTGADPAPLFLGRLPEPGPARTKAIGWARRVQVGLEVGPTPGVGGLDSGEIQRAIAGEVALFVTSHASVPEEMPRIRLAARIARRGWAESRHVATTRTPTVGPRADK